MIKNRIKELKMIKFSQLAQNPKNFRKHPKQQADAMSEVLQRIGWADAVLARETDDGLMLIDGHLRKELAPDDEVPVLILDVDESEADVILATHDPLGEMAEVNQSMLDDLIGELSTKGEGEYSIFDAIKTPDEIFAPATIDEQGSIDSVLAKTCPHCGLEL